MEPNELKPLSPVTMWTCSHPTKRPQYLTENALVLAMSGCISHEGPGGAKGINHEYPKHWYLQMQLCKWKNMKIIRWHLSPPGADSLCTKRSHLQNLQAGALQKSSRKRHVKNCPTKICLCWLRALCWYYHCLHVACVRWETASKHYNSVTKWEPTLTLHLILLSSRMFLAARSRWTNPLFERYFIPSAISRQNRSSWCGSSAHCLLSERRRRTHIVSQRVTMPCTQLHASHWKQLFKKKTEIKVTTHIILIQHIRIVNPCTNWLLW